MLVLTVKYVSNIKNPKPDQLLEAGAKSEVVVGSSPVAVT